jgi:hypothetical protein
MVLDKLHRDNVPDWNAELAGWCDESGGKHDSAGELAIAHGSVNSESFGQWNSTYAQIRTLNMFLEKLESSSFSQDLRDSYRAQALVIRAWIYFDLVRKWGGVPMIMKAQNTNEDLFVTRDKAAKCVELIVKDLDDAIAVNDNSFPYNWTGNDAGRISKAAALALKGRVLLYYASPQFNPNNDSDRWNTAYTATKAAKDQLSGNGYGLFEDFAALWYKKNEMNKEVVFVKRHEIPNFGHSWCCGTRQSKNIPTGFGGNNKPTWQLCKAFPMKSGVAINAEGSDYDDVAFWQNRDPRFTATVAYNTCKWAEYDDNEQRIWTYDENGTQSTTYMYCRKAIDPSTPSAQEAYLDQNTTDWIEIRYAEVLMNYAECANETGKTDEAYDVLKQIRTRAGITAGAGSMYGLKANMTKEEMREAIILERQIEFAFEGKRYWDLRRWRKLLELNGTFREGRKPVLNDGYSASDFGQDTNFEDKATYSKYFTDEIVISLSDAVSPLNFAEKYYFYPVHRDDLERNSKLQQTKNWDNGSFDPLN